MTEVADETIKSVQRRLFELGYVNADFIDGEMGPKTQASILDFRNRQGLPLVPVIDEQLLSALVSAPKIELPQRQTEVTAAQIAPKVEAVAATTLVVKRSWWGKFTAWFVGIPSTAVLVVGQFDQAVPIVTSGRTLFSEVPWQAWVILFIGLCGVFAIQAHMTLNSGKKAEDALVRGYQKDTVKSDSPVEPKA